MSHPIRPRLIPRPLSRDEVRAVDRRAIADYGLPGLVLMENAGRGAAELLMRAGIRGRVVICAGKGNNGGDGFVVARHLDNSGYDCEVLLCGVPEDLTGDAAVNYQVLERAGLAGQVLGASPDLAALEQSLAGADWIVDALLGTGTRGAIRAPFGEIIEAINRSGRNVFAIDLPSGLDCDTGQPLGACVRATRTATFVARKLGFDAPGAAAYTGAVDVVDIGVPRHLLERL